MSRLLRCNKISKLLIGHIELITDFKIEMENEYLNCEWNIPLPCLYIALPAMFPALAQSLRCSLNPHFYL